MTGSTGSLKILTKDERAGSTTTAATDSTVREPLGTTLSVTSLTKRSSNPRPVEITLPPLKGLPPPLIQTTADTLSDIKRRREERRRGVGGPLSSAILSPSPITSPPRHTTDMNHKDNTKISNGNHLSTINDPMPDYSAEKFIKIHGQLKDEKREKRICCIIL
jgi:hypothetical protein